MDRRAWQHTGHNAKSRTRLERLTPSLSLTVYISHFVMCPSNSPYLTAEEVAALREEPFSPSHTAGTGLGPRPVDSRRLQQTGQMEFSGLGKAFWEGTQHKVQELKRGKGWDKEALEQLGLGEELSGIESRAVVPCGFQGVPRLRGTVTPADPSECVGPSRGRRSWLRPRPCHWAQASHRGPLSMGGSRASRRAQEEAPAPSGDVPGKWQAPLQEVSGPRSFH